jgi:hypothetical protein
VLLEKILELAEHLKYKLKWRRYYASNLIEIYHINRRFINEDFVQDFLKQREKIIKGNRYKMSVRESSLENGENIIGEVRLYRKKKFIHKATLITKGEECNSKLIYWKFEE